MTHTDEQWDEGSGQEVEDLEAPAAEWGEVVGGIGQAGGTGKGLTVVVKCQLPTDKCTDPSCTGQTYCKPGTQQGCAKPTCSVTTVYVQ
jgi:hypothetical protein